VDAGAPGSERADELADEAFPLGTADPGDHGQSGMEVEGDRTAGGFEDEPVYPHLCIVGTSPVRVESNDPGGARRSPWGVRGGRR
jgi:hypothetical protein